MKACGSCRTINKASLNSFGTELVLIKRIAEKTDSTYTLFPSDTIYIRAVSLLVDKESVFTLLTLRIEVLLTIWIDALALSIDKIIVTKFTFVTREIIF